MPDKYVGRVIDALERTGKTFLREGRLDKAAPFLAAVDLLETLPEGANRTGQARYYDLEYLDGEVMTEMGL